MSEPNIIATQISSINPFLYSWNLLDNRINSRSDSYAFLSKSGWVLIDPLPILEEKLKGIGGIVAIIITARCHQRSSWRIRRLLKIPVYAPAYKEGEEEPIAPNDGEGLEEFPDYWYSEEAPPLDLKAIYTPGPCDPHYTLIGETPDNLSIMFSGDLLLNLPDRSLEVMPGEYQNDSELAFRSTHKLLNFTTDILCPSHGIVLKKSIKININLAISNYK